VASAVEDVDVWVPVGEVDVADDEAASLRTRNPGLDKSAVFGLYVEEAALNRKTYLASKVKLLVGIAIVHA
jgi:hypothetical protein